MELTTFLRDAFVNILKQNRRTQDTEGRTALLGWVLDQLPDPRVYQELSQEEFCSYLVNFVASLGSIASGQSQSDALIVFATKLGEDVEQFSQAEDKEACLALLTKLTQELAEQRLAARRTLENVATVAADRLRPSLVRLLDSGDKTVGTGFIVQRNDLQKHCVITSAQTVSKALGISPSDRPPTQQVTLGPVSGDPSVRIQASILTWRYAPDTGDDIAILALESLPTGCVPTPLVERQAKLLDNTYVHAISVLNTDQPTRSLTGQVKNDSGDADGSLRWFSIEPSALMDAPDREALSGSPVWSVQEGKTEESAGLIGMAVLSAASPVGSIRLIPAIRLNAALGFRTEAGNVISSQTPAEQAESIFYVHRPNEEERALEYLDRSRPIVLTGPQEIGKSAVMKYLEREAEQKIKSELKELKTHKVEIKGATMSYSTDAIDFCREMALQIALAVEPENEDQHKQVIHKRMTGEYSPLNELNRMMHYYILPKVGGRLLLMFDGIEHLSDKKFLAELLGMLKDWAQNIIIKKSPWEHLMLMLEVSRCPALLTQNRQAFNIAEAIEIGDFSREQIKECLQYYQDCYKIAWEAEDIERIVTEVGGHPGMVWEILKAARAPVPPRPVKEILSSGYDPEQLFVDHLSRLREKLKKASLVDIVRDLLKNPNLELTREQKLVLIDAGVIKSRKAAVSAGATQIAKWPEQLSNEQFKQLHAALLSAFPTKWPLTQLVFEGLNEQLEQIAGGETLTEIAYRLIQWTEAQGRSKEMVEYACRENSGNPILQKFAAQFSDLSPTPHDLGKENGYEARYPVYARCLGV